MFFSEVMGNRIQNTHVNGEAGGGVIFEKGENQILKTGKTPRPKGRDEVV